MTLFDHLKAITQHPYKADYWNNLTPKEKTVFSKYMIHRFLSMNIDWIDIVNTIQAYDLNSELTYKIFSKIIPKSTKFLKYIKGKASTNYDILLVELMCKHFKTSSKESIDYLNIIVKQPNWKSHIKELLELYGTEDKLIKKIVRQIKT